MGGSHGCRVSPLGIDYNEFVSQDCQEYDMLQHYDTLASLADAAAAAGGRLFAHCEAGVNRSGTLCLAYHIKRTGIPMLESAKTCKERRGRICTNQAFQLQLTKFVLEQ